VTTQEELNNLIVEKARDWIGTPYHHQMSLKGVGCDCIGLVRGVYSEIYGLTVEPPTYPKDWGDSNGREDIIAVGDQYLKRIPTWKADKGNLIAVRWKKSRVAKHVMIMTSKDTAIHAYNNFPVAEINLNRWWKDKISITFQFPILGVIN
jgi:NlpC/P60 family putative phage cell wall peptidase